MKGLLKSLTAGFACLLIAGSVFLTGCGVVPTYVPPEAQNQPGATPSAPPAAVASVPPTVAPQTASPAIPETTVTIDHLRVGDKLVIYFADVPTPMQPLEETVREDGMVSLPYNKRIKAAGKTKGQLVDEIRVLYVPSIFKQLTVSIRTEDRFFTVGGEVRTPARQIYVGSMTVLKCIAASGGFTEFANKRRVDLIRSSGKKETVDAVKAQDDPRLDVPVYPGDQVIVRRRIF